MEWLILSSLTSQVNHRFRLSSMANKFHKRNNMVNSHYRARANKAILLHQVVNHIRLRHGRAHNVRILLMQKI